MSFKFRNFPVYKETRDFIVCVFRLTRKFPGEFRYISDQVNRSALSVALNIAEGSAKRSDRDFNRYIENALGSITESLSALEVAHDFKLITPDEFVDAEKRIESITNQLGGLSKYLKNG